MAARSLNLQQLFDRKHAQFLHVLDTGGPIMEVLTDLSNPVCPLLGGEIQIKKELGRGVFGVVYEIDFPGQGTKKYALKELEPPTTVYKIRPEDIATAANFYRGLKWLDLKSSKYGKDLEHYTLEDIMKVNGVTDPSIHILKPQILLPVYKKSCYEKRRLVDAQRGDDTSTGGKWMVCIPQYTEYIIALLTGNLMRTGTCINFVDTFYFSTCYRGSSGVVAQEPTFFSKVLWSDVEKKSVKQYVFMEMISGSLRRMAVECFQYLTSILIQTIGALAIAQQKLGLVHADLHTDNVFIQRITPEIEWKGEKLYDANWFEYRIKGKSVYFPACPFLVKIGDYGFASTYKHPRILNEKVAQGMFDVMPSEFSNSYDLLFFLGDILGAHLMEDVDVSEKLAGYRERIQYYTTHPEAVNAKENLSLAKEEFIQYSAPIRYVDMEFLARLCKRIFVMREDVGIITRESALAKVNEYIDRSGRPRVAKIKDLAMDPTVLLTDKRVMGEAYTTRPAWGKIVCIGEI